MQCGDAQCASSQAGARADGSCAAARANLSLAAISILQARVIDVRCHADQLVLVGTKADITHRGAASVWSSFAIGEMVGLDWIEPLGSADKYDG
jgi:hypothetical protein